VTPLELTAAYVPFANGGYRPDVHFISRVTTTAGKVIYEHPRAKNARVISPEAVSMMNAMMTETITGGTAGKAAFGWPAAGKTGTSQKSRDAWFIGYTSNLTTGVWFGNDDGSPTKNVTGGSLPAIAWHDFMVAAHQGVKVKALPGGNWTSSNPEQAIPIPLAPVGEEPAGDGPVVEAPQPVKRPSRTVQAEKPAMPEEKPMQTGSIKRPKAEIGGNPVKGEKTVLDVLLGN